MFVSLRNRCPIQICCRCGYRILLGNASGFHPHQEEKHLGFRTMNRRRHRHQCRCRQRYIHIHQVAPCWHRPDNCHGSRAHHHRPCRGPGYCNRTRPVAVCCRPVGIRLVLSLLLCLAVLDFGLRTQNQPVHKRLWSERDTMAPARKRFDVNGIV